MTDIDRILEEVERLDREATPGPWRPEGASIRVNLPGGIEYQWATAAYPRDNNLIAHYRTAAPLLAAEVRRLRAELDGAHATVDAVFSERDQYMQGQTEATAIARALRADLEEARLTLAAEQGRQEGAPSEGWHWTDGVWSKDYPSGHHVRVRQGIGGGNAVMHVTHHSEPHRRSAWDNQRAAMLAADSAAG